MIDKLINLVISLLLFLLPLFFLPLANSPVDHDKQIIVVLFTLILFVLFIVKTATEKSIRIIKTPVDLFFILLPILALISTYLYAPNKTESLLAPMSAGTILTASILYFVLTNLATNPKKNILSPLVISSGLVAIITIIQQFKLIPAVTPLGGMLPTFTFLLPVGLFLAVKTAVSLEKHQTNSKNASLAGLFKSNLVETVSLFLIVCALTLTGYHLLTDSKPIILPFIFGWAILMEVYKNFPNFLLGVGPNNFSYAFTAGKPAVINSTPFWSAIATTSTSFFLTLATEIGAIGGILYLVVARRLLSIPKREEHQNIAKAYSIALISTLILQLLLPTTITLFILMVILLALAVEKKEVKTFTLPDSVSFVGVIFVILALGALYFQGKSYAAETYYRMSLNEINSKNVNKAYEYSLKALSTYPYSDRYYSLNGAISMNMASLLSQDKDATDSAKQKDISSLTQQAINSAQAAISLNPANSQNYGQLYQAYQPLIGKVKGTEQQALDVLNKQSMLDPTSPQPRLTAGMFFLSFGQLDQAKALINQAINLKPDWNAAHYNMAVALAQSKNYKEAAAELQKTIDLTPQNSEDYKKLQQELEQLKTMIPPESTPTGEVKEGTTGSPQAEPTAAKPSPKTSPAKQPSNPPPPPTQ